jgi:hypothetical protein
VVEEVEPMRLTWRDAAASAFVGTAAVLYALWAAGVAMTTYSTKAIGLVVFGLGWAACVTNQREMAVVYGVDPKGPRPTILFAAGTTVLGAVALIAGVVAIFTGSEPFVLVLLGALVALWFAATARHAFGWWARSADEPERRLDRAA